MSLLDSAWGRRVPYREPFVPGRGLAPVLAAIQTLPDSSHPALRLPTIPPLQLHLPSSQGAVIRQGQGTQGNLSCARSMTLRALGQRLG